MPDQRGFARVVCSERHSWRAVDVVEPELGADGDAMGQRGGSGRVTRVRAGPYSSREAAEKARAQLKKAGFDGQVMAK